MICNPQKIQFCATINLEKRIKVEEGTTVFIQSLMQPVYKNGPSFEDYLEMIDGMLCTLFTFTASGNGWIINQIIRLETRFVASTLSKDHFLSHLRVIYNPCSAYSTFEITTIIIVSFVAKPQLEILNMAHHCNPMVRICVA